MVSSVIVTASAGQQQSTYPKCLDLRNLYRTHQKVLHIPNLALFSDVECGGSAVYARA
jgi:hypothetical protein